MAEIQSEVYVDVRGWQNALRLVTQCGLLKRNHHAADRLTEINMVGSAGLEPATPCL